LHGTRHFRSLYLYFDAAQAQSAQRANRWASFVNDGTFDSSRFELGSYLPRSFAATHCGDRDVSYL
jgi:hypothetical protein